MIKIVLAFDKFKCSMTASEACDCCQRGILDIIPSATVVRFPAADGGEGTVEAFSSSLGGVKKSCSVTPPHLTVGDEKVISEYLITEDGLCVMEISSASGLTLVPEKLRNPMTTSTYGTGEMIREALDSGCRRFLIGIGGSATCDCGIGMASALGARFYDRNGDLLSYPTGKDLININNIDITDLDSRIRESEFKICCDVDNPLFGENGASFVFAPQKGASPEDVLLLDSGLRSFSSVIKDRLGISVSEIPGSGAAGGLGAGFISFFGAELVGGFDAVSDAAGLDGMISDADLVITGEGKIDAQTLCGKTVSGVVKKARSKNIPVIVIGGCVDAETAKALIDNGASEVLSLMTEAMTIEYSVANGRKLMYERTRDLKRLPCLGDLMSKAMADNMRSGMYRGFCC